MYSTCLAVSSFGNAFSIISSIMSSVVVLHPISILFSITILIMILGNCNHHILAFLDCHISQIPFRIFYRSASSYPLELCFIVSALIASLFSSSISAGDNFSIFFLNFCTASSFLSVTFLPFVLIPSVFLDLF